MKQHLKEAVELVERGLDKNVRLCVTGLSRAGKTAFISSFVNQLLHHKNSTQLPFWLAHAEGRILAVKIEQHPDLHIPAFPYSDALKSIEEEARWPESTRNVSQIRLSIKYQIKNRWIRKLQKISHLNVDIVDYPGEWLLDLPLLQMDYQQWSHQFYNWLETEPQKTLAQEFWDSLKAFESQQKFDETKLKAISQKFRSFLSDCKQQDMGIHFIQPGRFVMPGDLEGAPVLDFFPCLDEAGDSNSNLAQLAKRYNYYRDQVVKPFFKEYFSKVDRQILLVDCLATLNQGYDSYKELQSTLSKLITSFNYGESNWFKRMFQPNISKLLVAATKSDHLPPEQHPHLKTFLSNMLNHSENLVGYQGVEVENTVFSAIEVTEPVTTNHEGQALACVKGLELHSGKAVVNYPGKIPTEPMSKQQWQQQEFNFVNFAIPELPVGKALPHQRMDQVIQMLIGDKFL